jgi:PAS domain S-box-containing protein
MSRNHLDKSSKSNQRKSDRRYSEQKHGNQELPLVGDIIQCSSSAIAASDLEGNMTYVNPSFLKIWGFDDSQEIFGKPFWRFWLGMRFLRSEAYGRKYLSCQWYSMPLPCLLREIGKKIFRTSKEFYLEIYRR